MKAEHEKGIGSILSRAGVAPVLANNVELTLATQLFVARKDIAMLIRIIQEADPGAGFCGPWCNSVHSPGGQCEGMSGVWLTIEEIRKRHNV